MSLTSQRPNVLLICADHWPGSHLGAAAHPSIITPTLDRLAEAGMLFRNAYSTTPTCVPARRALMTGTTARTHGDRIFNSTLPMPDLPTLPAVLGDAGYQTFAVGKLHVYPQRDRIGFDEAIINEEGRHQFGIGRDDYEMFLTDGGFHGEECTHGMGHNDYTVRPFHLPEEYHQTHWTTKQMCRAIQRRNPDRPGFWYCSYTAPHPPVTPPADYLAMYDTVEIEDAVTGVWSSDFEKLPHATRARAQLWKMFNTAEKTARARRGFYAQCTYIDHQLRLLIGTLREEGLLESTWIVFTADHGDMLGDHQQWAKPTMLDGAARVPLLVVPPASWWDDTDTKLRPGTQESRLAALRDIMPTVLDACGVEIPQSVEGYSLLQSHRRETIYCEHWENEMAIRMIRDRELKLIWYPVGNRFQLFNMVDDPEETRDLSNDTAHTETVARLKALLRRELYGRDLEWVNGEELVGEPDRPVAYRPDPGLISQRGWRL